METYEVSTRINAVSYLSSLLILHSRHACGENPSRSYDATRMDSAWAFRQAYNEARKIKEAQDKYCDIAEKGDWKRLKSEEWPENYQWEALVDVLRGKVRVRRSPFIAGETIFIWNQLSVHCYEPVDFDAFIRVSKLS